MKKMISALLALLLFITLPLPVRAADPDDCIEQLICYYQYHQEEASLDIRLLLEQLSQSDARRGWQWEKIMDHWSWVNTEMVFDAEVLPDGLPGDDSLCIVVLGYALKRNGDMQDELIGRLQTALKCAEKYPNAYIAVTGGGTARNTDDTEAGQMARWLRKKGIDKDRIIVEEKSMSTVNNAQYTCAMLNEQYPQVEHLAIVTSDYHQGRGALLFEAEAILSGYAMSVVSVASYRTKDHQLDSPKKQAAALAELAGYSTEDFKKPKLTRLKGLSVTGDSLYPAGSELDLQISAEYSNGYRKNVTGSVNYSGFDFQKTGPQTVTIQYQEDGTVLKTTYGVEFLPPETIPPETDAPSEPAAVPVQAIQPASPEPSLNILISAAVVLCCLLALLLILKKRRK